mgnify:CR=1 FL=1
MVKKEESKERGKGREADGGEGKSHQNSIHNGEDRKGGKEEGNGKGKRGKKMLPLLIAGLLLCLTVRRCALCVCEGVNNAGIC